MAEIKQTNFRLDAESTEKFRSFCEEQGFTAAQGFDHLLQVLEIDRAKQVVPARKTEIEDFEMHAKALLASYVQSVRLTEDTEARVREQFAGQLESKDQIVADYQVQLKEAKEKISDLQTRNEALLGMEAEAANLRIELSSKESEIQKLEQKHADQLQDKAKNIQMLEEKLAVTERKAAAYESVRTERDSLAFDLRVAQDALKDQKKDAEIQAERAARTAEKALEEALRAAEAKAHAEMETIREALRASEIEAERRLREEEKASSVEIRRLEAEIRQLEKEKADLREQLVKAERAGMVEK